MTRRRPSQARAEVLGTALERVPVTTALPVLPDDRPTIADLAAELRPMVFRLLDAGKPDAAGALVETYRDAADAALWREVLPGGTGSLAVVR